MAGQDFMAQVVGVSRLSITRPTPSQTQSFEMVPTLPEPLANEAISSEEETTNSIEVSTLKYETGKCFNHNKVMQAKGCKWNTAWKHSSSCQLKLEAALFDLRKMDTLTAHDTDVNRNDLIDSLPNELLLTVLQQAVVCPQPYSGGPLGSFIACRIVCTRWRTVCAEDSIVAAAATQLPGNVRLRKLLCASDDEARLVPYSQSPTFDEAVLMLGAMRTSPNGPFERRLAAKARRKRALLPYPSPVLRAVKRREKQIKSSHSKRNRLPMLRAYDEQADDWYGWWTPEIATRGAMVAFDAGLDPFVGTHVEYLKRIGLEKKTDVRLWYGIK